MVSPPDSVSESIVFEQFIRHFRPFVHPFIQTDVVTTISHEWLEQFR